MEILIALVIIALVGVGIVALGSLLFKKRDTDSSTKSSSVNKQHIIREANKKLAHNPHNAQALTDLSTLYFEEQSWDKAFTLYELMANIASIVPEISASQAALRMGICALKLERYPEAIKAFLLARQSMQENFEINFYLGQALYYSKEYEKAATALKKALVFDPNHPETNLLLGNSLYNTKKFRDAITFLKKALDLQPDNKEILFLMGVCLMETNNMPQAHKIFSHLRPHPEFGARSSLNAGLLNMRGGKFESAIQDFGIGLKHQDTPPEVLVQLHYNLAQCYLKLKNISNAVASLKRVDNIAPAYKDTANLIRHYQELNQNSNLQIFLISNNSDFVSLCRRFVVKYYTGATVNITDISVKADYTEILTEINTSKWEDDVLFRFYRSGGAVGELFIRDFHAKIKDAKVGRGVCVCGGSFSQDARNYAECRPIELVDKTALNKILQKIDMNK